MQERANLLQELAQRYNTSDFIKSDPVQFPHRFKEKRDVEISAILASWIAYGNRKQIILTLEKLHSLLGASPYEYIRTRSYVQYKDCKDCLYRFYTYEDFYEICEHLYRVYETENQPSIEAKLLSMQSSYPSALSLLENFISLFPNQRGIPQNCSSACKRLCLLLRWLIRKDGIVDLGIWDLLPQSELIIPLDTHVFRLSKELGLTSRRSADMKTALEITQELKKVFPLDPTLEDFALFGYGVSQ